MTRQVLVNTEIIITANFKPEQTVYIKIIKLSDRSEEQALDKMTYDSTNKFYYYAYTFTSTDSYRVITECPLIRQRAVEVYDVVGVTTTAAAAGNVYCTSADVARVMNLTTSDGTRFTFGTTTVPTEAEITKNISEATDRIDRLTHHAWRSVTVTDEYHDFKRGRMRRRLWGGREYRSVSLNHRSITTLDTGEGDKIEVWNGSTYIDYVADKTEARESDFWLDYSDGVIYFTGSYPIYMRNSVRVTYRYGESSVPTDVRDCCAKMVAIDALLVEENSALSPSGENAPAVAEKIRQWEKEINEVIDQRREIYPVVM